MAKAPFPELDPGHKRTTWETIIITTPVILTVMATVLAGLSSSEMSSSQYFRSLAAQMQAKVSDQWGYFQAKKLRAEQCGNTVEILRGISQSNPANRQELTQTIDQLFKEMQRVMTADLSDHWKAAAATRPDGGDDLAAFARGDIPQIQPQPVGDQQIADAILALDSRIPEADLERQAGQIPQEGLDQAITTANENAAAFEKALDQTELTRNRIERSCAAIAREAAAFERVDSTNSIQELISQLSTAVAIAGLNFNANRYQREAHDNQVLADLLELEVRRQGFTSDRHRVRSREFFYGMLGAQAGVTIATFSLAVQRRNLLWGLAASAGLAAVTFAAYVYMFV